MAAFFVREADEKTGYKSGGNMGRRDEEISCGNRNPTGYDGESDTLGSELGTIDIEMQVKTLDLYLEQMEQKMEDMRTEQKERIRLYQCVGVTGGIFLAIILL